MIQIKKTILTLVALLAISTGAWAEGYYDININFDPVYNPEFTSFMCDVMGPDMPSGTLDLSIDKSYIGSFRVDNGMCSSQIHSLDAGDHTWSAEFTPDGSSEKSTESRSFTIDQGFAYVYIDDPEQSSIEMGVGESRNFRGHVDGPESSEVNISSSNDNVAKFRASSSFSYGFEGYIDAVGAGTATITVSFAGNKNYKAAESKTLTVTVLAPAASGPEVAWDKATKTGTFTMPGGNVTLEPEYYPQATAAEGAVTAADADARATTDDPLVKVDATKLTGATKLMYFVSNSGTTAPAYDAEGWTDQLPTAEGFTQQGIVYVWYYPVGIDEGVDGATATYSDGDICLQSITARIAPEPTYAVTFAEGTDPNEWTADPNADVTKGQTVTVTYTGAKKVIGVKAEKKVPLIVNPVVGQIIGSDGKYYDANATLPDGVTAVAMIAYVGSETGVDGYTHGLALALSDVSANQLSWDNTYANNAGKTAAEWCSDWNTTKTITGGTWMLPSKDQWNKMINACKNVLGTKNDFRDLRDGFNGISGASNLQSAYYWSSTKSNSDEAWYCNFLNGNWEKDYTDYYCRVRACLAF